MRKSFTWFFSLTLLLGLWSITSVSYAADCNLSISASDVELVTDLSTVCDGEDLVYQVDNFAPGDYQFAFNYDGTTPGGFTDNNQLTTPEGLSFTVTVKEVATGCISNTITITATNVLPLEITTPETQDALCNGSNGEITINWTGGVGPYMYYVYVGDSIDAAADYPTGATQVTSWQVGRPAGTYSVAVNNGAGCLDLSESTNWRTVTIDEPDPIAATASVTDPITCNSDSAEVTVYVTPGSGTPDSDGEYTVTLAGVTMTTTGQEAVFPKVDAGIYTAVVKDANNCSFTTGNIMVKEPLPIDFDIAITDVDCNGYGNGEITVSNVTGGDADYTLVLTDYSTGALVQTISPVSEGGSATFTGLDPVRYSLTITDNFGCSVEYENPNGSGNVISVQSPAAIDYSVSITDVKCKGDATGKISISNVTGGSGSYLYSFNGGAYYGTASDTTGLLAGTYTISVKNSDGSDCPQDSTVVVDEPTDALTATADNVKSPSCPGGTDGHFKVIPDGGSGDYMYSVDGSAYYTNPVITETEGTHEVTVMDANECTFTFDVTIPTLDPNVITYTQDNITCYGDSTGHIMPSVVSWAGGMSDGEPNRAVKFWYSTDAGSVYSNGMPLTSSTSLYAGTYYIGATDQYGCTFDSLKDGTPDVLEVEITQNEKLEMTAALVTENATCFDDPDGIIKLTAVGGTPFGGGQHAQYWLSSQNIDVSLVDPADFNYFDSYVNDTSTVLIQALKGTYYVYVRDNDCTVAKWPEPITVAGYDPVVITDPTADDITDVLCKGDTTGAVAIAAATGGSSVIDPANLTYTLQMDDGGWMNVDNRVDLSSPEFSNLGAGDYRIVVKDSEGCSGDTTALFSISEPATALSFVTDSTDITCNGAKDGIIHVKISGGTKPYKVQISNQGWLQLGDTVTVKDVVIYTAGTYTVNVMDASGCEADPQTATINEPEAVMVSLTPGFDEDACPNSSNGWIAVNVTGGNTDDYNLALISTTDTTYYVATAGYDSIVGLDAGVYTVKAKDMSGATCGGWATTEVVDPNEITFSAEVTEDVYCKGSSTGVISVTNVDGGTEGAGYTAHLTHLSGGSADSAVVDGAATFGSLAAGKYLVDIKDGNGCWTSSTDTLTVTEPEEALALKATWIRDIGCTEPGKFVLTATGGNGDYTFYWAPTDPNTGHVLLDDMPGAGTVWTPAGDNDSLTVSVTTAATYIVWVKDANGMGCTVGGEGGGTPVNAWRVKILNDVPPIAFNVAHTNLTCYENASGTITVSNITGGEASSMDDYVVKIDGVAIADTVATGLSADTITVTVEDLVGGCTTDSTVILTQPEELTVSLGKVDGSFTCTDATEGWLEADAAGGSGSYTYQLYQNGSPFGSEVGISSFFVPIGATYSVKVMDGNCEAMSNDTTISQIAPVTIDTLKDVTCYGEEHASVELMTSGEPGRTFMARYRVVTGVTGGVESYGAYSAWMSFSGDTIIDGLSFANEYSADAGYYYFEVKDSEGCLGDTAKITLVPVQHPLQAAYETTADGLGATLTITGGISPYSYQVDSGAVVQLAEDEDMFQVVDLKSPASIVTVTDAHGCSVSDTISVDPITMTANPDMGNDMAQTFDVTLTFNREVTVNDGDITGGTYTAGTGTEFVVAMEGMDGDTLSLVVLPDSVMDASGNMFAGDTLTYIIGDNTPPMAEMYSPNDSTLEDNHPTLVVTFSEDVTFNEGGKLYITKVGGTQPKLTIPVTADMVSGNTLTVTYTYDPEIGGLNGQTDYYVTFDAGLVVDAAGNTSEELSDNTAWTFTTGGWATGVENPVSDLKFKVYPNPFSSYVTVTNADKLSRIIVTNVAGQRVKDIVSPTETIQLNDLRSGVYFMTLIANDVVAKTERIVKR